MCVQLCVRYGLVMCSYTKLAIPVDRLPALGSFQSSRTEAVLSLRADTHRVASRRHPAGGLCTRSER